MSPVQGFTRFRRHQFGRQAAFGTAIAAKRAYAFTGVPAYGEPWVDVEVDTGSIDPVVAPTRGPNDLTASLTDPALRYNNIPLMLSAFFGGGVVATGGPAYTRLYDPASTTVDPLDAFVYEFGDDVLTDWMQMRDGMLESVEFTAPEGKGALTASMSWRFGAMFGSGFTDFPDSPVVPTALAVDPNEPIVYGKDLALYIASDPYDLTYSGALISDALHTFTLRLTKQYDAKRWLNGSQSFDVDAWAVTGRTIELECSFAKTTDTVGIGSESDAWYSEQAVDRYIRLYAESTIDADTGVPNSWDQSFPLRYRTRTEGESGGNSLVVLTGQAFYAADHNIGTYSSEVVNTLADADF
jgi:hypothetical protein